MSISGKNHEVGPTADYICSVAASANYALQKDPSLGLAFPAEAIAQITRLSAPNTPQLPSDPVTSIDTQALLAGFAQSRGGREGGIA